MVDTLPRGRRRFMSALALLAGACAQDGATADLPRLHDVERGSALIREVAKAVVRLRHPAGAVGTGSFISEDGLLLTNDHVLGSEQCAREGCWISVAFAHQRGSWSLGPRELFAVPVHADVGLDMVALQLYEDERQEARLPTPNFLRLEPRSASELIGERVTVVGHPLGRLKKWSEGLVIDADGDWFESTLFTLPGSSGSPIVDAQGRLVGLLHRGAEGFDRFTRTGSHVSSLATAAAALERALGAELPATVISLEQELTREQALAYRGAFLAGSAANASVAGVDTPLLALLGDACDEGLARDDYTSLEQLQSGFTPCLAAIDFIECRRDVPEPPHALSCPEAAVLDVWRTRLETVTRKQRAFNGSVDLFPISIAIEGFAEDQAAAEHAARTNILAALGETQPPLDFSLASYLAGYGIEDYDRQSTREWIVKYSQVPHYERSAWDITLGALWLYDAGALDAKRALGIARQLYENDQVSLGDKLRIEEVLYNSDAL